MKRLQILLAEGGVTLDSDAFVVSKLDTFFHDDCTIGWPKNQSIGNQVSRGSNEFLVKEGMKDSFSISTFRSLSHDQGHNL